VRRRLAALLALVASAVALPAYAVVAVRTRTAVAYHPRPVARTAAVATTAAVTVAAVGSVHRSLPASCSSVNVGGAVYSQCGSTWYQPRYAGSDVTYVVVNPPR
jgi:hypothetical protein